MSSTGLCACGCGTPTLPAPYTYRSRGWVAGEPVRFVRGHETKRRGTVHDSRCIECARANGRKAVA